MLSGCECACTHAPPPAHRQQSVFQLRAVAEQPGTLPHKLLGGHSRGRPIPGPSPPGRIAAPPRRPALCPEARSSRACRGTASCRSSFPDPGLRGPFRGAPTPGLPPPGPPTSFPQEQLLAEAPPSRTQWVCREPLGAGPPGGGGLANQRVSSRFMDKDQLFPTHGQAARFHTQKTEPRVGTVQQTTASMSPGPGAAQGAQAPHRVGVEGLGGPDVPVEGRAGQGGHQSSPLGSGRGDRLFGVSRVPAESQGKTEPFRGPSPCSGVDVPADVGICWGRHGRGLPAPALQPWVRLAIPRLCLPYIQTPGPGSGGGACPHSCWGKAAHPPAQDGQALLLVARGAAPHAALAHLTLRTEEQAACRAFGKAQPLVPV